MAATARGAGTPAACSRCRRVNSIIAGLPRKNRRNAFRGPPRGKNLR